MAEAVVPVLAAFFEKRIRALRGDAYSDDREIISMSELQTFQDIIQNENLIQCMIGLDKDEFFSSAPALRQAFKLLDLAHKQKLSGTKTVRDQTKWAQDEEQKLRLLWSHFLQLCRKSDSSHCQTMRNLKNLYFAREEKAGRRAQKETAADATGLPDYPGTPALSEEEPSVHGDPSDVRAPEASDDDADRVSTGDDDADVGEHADASAHDGAADHCGDGAPNGADAEVMTDDVLRDVAQAEASHSIIVRETAANTPMAKSKSSKRPHKGKGDAISRKSRKRDQMPAATPKKTVAASEPETPTATPKKKATAPTPSTGRKSSKRDQMPAAAPKKTVAAEPETPRATSKKKAAAPTPSTGRKSSKRDQMPAAAPKKTVAAEPETPTATSKKKAAAPTPSTGKKSSKRDQMPTAIPKKTAASFEPEMPTATPTNKATVPTSSTGRKQLHSKHNASTGQIQGWKDAVKDISQKFEDCAMEAQCLSALDGACLLMSALGDGLGTLLKNTMRPVLRGGDMFDRRDCRLIFMIQRDKLLWQVKEASRAIVQFTCVDATQGAACHMGGCIMLALAVAGIDADDIKRAKGMLSAFQPVLQPAQSAGQVVACIDIDD